MKIQIRIRVFFNKILKKGRTDRRSLNQDYVDKNDIQLRKTQIFMPGKLISCFKASYDGRTLIFSRLQPFLFHIASLL